MNPSKEILTRAGKVFSDEGEPVLNRIHPELRSILYDCEPGKFEEAVNTVNGFLKMSGEKRLTHDEIEDAEQGVFLVRNSRARG